MAVDDTRRPCVGFPREERPGTRKCGWPPEAGKMNTSDLLQPPRRNTTPIPFWF